MTMRLIPHSAAISEFVASYNGDCGETAELTLLHVINPTAYPLDAAALSAIVKRDISKGWASASGSEPIGSIANDLTALGVHYTNYGYSQPAAFDWRAMLAQWGGIKPVVFEYAKAGNLPSDEAGVQYHFNCCLGWNSDLSAGLFADGDNAVERGGGTGLVTYSLADLAAADVCGMLVGEYQLGGAVTMVPTGWKDDGVTLTAPNGKPVIHGFRDFVLGFPGGWPAWNWPLENESHLTPLELSNPALGGGAHQPFRATLLEWTAAKGAFVCWVGQEYLALEASLAQATAQVSSLTAQVTALQAQVAGEQPTAAQVANDTAIAALKTALG